jgi:hypothetical protein
MPTSGETVLSRNFAFGFKTVGGNAGKDCRGSAILTRARCSALLGWWVRGRTVRVEVWIKGGLSLGEVDEAEDEEGGQEVEHPVFCFGAAGDELDEGVAGEAEAQAVGDGPA